AQTTVRLLNVVRSPGRGELLASKITHPQDGRIILTFPRSVPCGAGGRRDGGCVRITAGPDSYYPSPTAGPCVVPRGCLRSEHDRRLPELPGPLQVRRESAGRPAQGQDQVRQVRGHDRDREPRRVRP